MYFSLTIFGLAVISFLVILFVKYREFSTGKIIFAKDLRHKAEEKIIYFYRLITFLINDFLKKLIIFIKNFPINLAHVSHFYWRKFAKKVDDFFIKIRHKK